MIALQQLIPEYVLEPITALGRYLKSSEQEKKEEIAYEFCPELLFPWINKLEVDSMTETGKTKKILPKKYSEDSEAFEVLDYLRDKRPKLFQAFIDYAFEQFNRRQMHSWSRGTGYPSWNYMDFREYVKNTWMIHFSDHATDIWRQQKFTHGMGELETLGLTTYHPEKSKQYGGYNFAFALDDFEKYGRERGFGSRGWKYGKGAVLFRASGVKTWHWGDEEPQVIFWGPSAKDIVLLENLEDSDWGVTSNEGRVIFKTEKLSDLVDWVVNNFEQYRRVLLPTKVFPLK